MSIHLKSYLWKTKCPGAKDFYKHTVEVCKFGLENVRVQAFPLLSTGAEDSPSCYLQFGEEVLHRTQCCVHYSFNKITVCLLNQIFLLLFPSGGNSALNSD